MILMWSKIRTNLLTLVCVDNYSHFLLIFWTSAIPWFARGETSKGAQVENSIACDVI